jgi:hypothetical protein
MDGTAYSRPSLPALALQNDETSFHELKRWLLALYALPVLVYPHEEKGLHRDNGRELLHGESYP